MTSARLKYATPELLERFYGSMPKRTSRAIVAVDGERVVGVAGVMQQDGRAVAFTEMNDEIRANKRLMIHAGRMLQLMFAEEGEVYAMQDAVDGADVLLRHYGFEPAGKGVWAWRA